MSEDNKDRLPNVCICGSTRIYRRSNIGWDVWEGGEENQHEEHCLECGATRLVVDWLKYPDTVGTAYGKWRTPDNGCIDQPAREAEEVK